MEAIRKIKKVVDAIFQYFLKKFEKESYTIKQKAFAYVFLNLCGLALNSVYVAVMIIYNKHEILLTNYLAFPVILLNLIFIKTIRFRHASNFFTISLILIFIISIILPHSGLPMNEFIDEFYFLLAFLVLTILFSTEMVIIINSAIIMLGTLGYYFVRSGTYKADLISYTDVAIINFEFAVFMITVMLVITTRIIRKNIEYADKQAKQAEIQKDRAVNAFTTVAMTSETLHDMSVVINDLTVNLNTSTNKQAVNIEEMSSTIEVLNQSIVKNAEYAGLAARSSGERTMVVRRSERLLKRVISSIRDISSRVTFIQDVARQTNILSLNASIEAARAGKSGRGFTAVANGIKKLADQSQKSAKDIISLVNEGLAVSDQANDYLSAIVENSEKSTELMTSISEALMEQINNITQINIGMSEINNAAQTNANIVDDLATNVEIMKQNSEIQRDLFHEESKGL
ncbi:MAG: methyl-accepting chemotaxis protein [Bacteroidales bacterium]